jgi:prefoldin subunit 5
VFYHEPEPEERIEHIEKMMEKMPEEIEEKLETYFEAYQEELINRIDRLLVALGDGIRALLGRLSEYEKIEGDIDSLAADMDMSIGEVAEKVTSCLETLEDIRATVQKLLE